MQFAVTACKVNKYIPGKTVTANKQRAIEQSTTCKLSKIRNKFNAVLHYPLQIC